MEHSYCKYVLSEDAHPLHIKYHNNLYGFPVEDDNMLFGRLVLEINQAGLSWLTILKKRDNFFRAFEDFDIDKVAAYGEKERERLLSDAGIIRNKLKVDAAIHNARQVKQLQKDFGSYKAWLDRHQPMSKEEWVKLFKKHFKFVGGEIVGEFLMSTGYLKGAHDPQCPVYREILKWKPSWTRA